MMAQSTSVIDGLSVKVKYLNLISIPTITKQVLQTTGPSCLTSGDHMTVQIYFQIVLKMT